MAIIQQTNKKYFWKTAADSAKVPFIIWPFILPLRREKGKNLFTFKHQRQGLRSHNETMMAIIIPSPRLLFSCAAIRPGILPAKDGSNSRATYRRSKRNYFTVILFVFLLSGGRECKGKERHTQKH